MSQAESTSKNTITLLHMRGLILDFDGLIIDSETLTANVAMEIVAERGGKSRLSDWAPLFGPTGPDVDAAWGRTLRTLLGPEVDITEFDTLLTERRRPLLDALEPLPGVLEVMDAARAKDWKVGLATGHLGSPLMDILDRLGLLPRFDAIVRTREVPRPKPAPDIFLETARRLELDPAECLVLEDSLAGYQAAYAAGMTVVVCPCEVTAFSAFPDEARIVESLLEVNLDDWQAPEAVVVTSTRSSRHINAPRPEVFKALLDAESVQQWMVPDGMTSHIHEYDGREGGTFRISLTYEDPERAGKTSGQTDTFHGRFTRIVPHSEIVQVVEFEPEDPGMQGEMTIRYLLEDSNGGTLVTGIHEDLPPGLSVEDNELGWSISMDKLAKLVEGP